MLICYLLRFNPLAGAETVAGWDLVAVGKGFLVIGFLEAIIGGSVSFSRFGGCECFSNSSTKFVRLKDAGMRFTRSSTRVRRL